ncbi:copper transporter, partial [Georgenia sp. 10Sc9-8]|nr:copper transporter [Georgenia halotolerans]
MIDFRYHLVSLISVFLALAVGIVLGAGPLRDTIGETLTGQVQDLRVDRERLRAELEASEVAVGERNDFIEGTAPVVLEDLLPGRTVALVTLPGTEDEAVETVRARLDQAGAVVIGEVAVTEEWSDPEDASFRDTFSGQLLGHLAPAPEEEATTAEILGTSLGQALTGIGNGGLDDGTSEDSAATLLEMLVSAEVPLVTVTSEPTELADATVLIGPPPQEPVEESETPDAEAEATAAEERAAHVELAMALAEAGEGSVTVGAAENPEDLVAVVRGDGSADDAVTTVDSVGAVTAGVSAPMALAVAMSGSHGHFGSELDAEEPVPPHSPLPEDEVGATGDDDAAGDGDPAGDG